MKNESALSGKHIVVIVSVIFLVGLVVTRAFKEEIDMIPPEKYEEIARTPSDPAWLLIIFACLTVFIIIADAIKIEGPMV